MKTRNKGRGGRKLSPTEVTRNKEQEKEKSTIELEHVLGMTVYSNPALTCEPRSGLVAYPAGCVLVLLDSVKYKQVGTLHTPRKSITAAQFSPDGRYVLTGESGLQPAIRVWELSRMVEVGTLRGHSVGIASVSFSPRMREIIVVGDAQDMMISVWTWPGKGMTALNKFSDEIYAMAVSDDSKYFVTVGNRHVKFYYMETLQTWTRHADNSCPIPLPTRCGVLDNLKENCFCDVICGRGRSSSFVFVVAVSGILCQINRNRLLERWVNVNMTTACCLTADENNLFVGGTNGIIRMFRSLDLQIIMTLPRPHNLGLDIAQVTSSYIENMSEDETEKTDQALSPNHPGTRALTYDPVNKILTAVYDDHSIYIWGRDCKVEMEGSRFYFTKRYSSMYHRGCVWDLDTYPAALDAESEGGALGGAFPPGTLISVSADGTLRAWDVCAKICKESLLKRNSLSADCLKIIYNNEIEAIRRSCEKLRQQCKPREGSNGPSARHSKHSFSVVAVCPEGLHIATGNRHGRVCIYDTNSMKTIATMLAHEAEITALCYSITKRYKVLASGSRDRMIHVMDASRDYHLLTTLDDHSSTITAINFTYIARCLLMVTSSLDMSVLVRAYLDTSLFSFKPVRAIVEKKSVMDFTIHPWAGTIALACQDRLVRVYSVMSSMENNSFRGCPTYGGQLIKIQVDPSGQYLLTACSNKTINLLQFNTGQMMSTFNGHAESITCVKFSHNMKHVISSAVDGCIFLWRLPERVTYAVKREMAEMGRLTRGMVLSERWKKSRLLHSMQPYDIKSEPDFQLSHASCDLKASSSLGLDETNKDHMSYKKTDQPGPESVTRPHSTCTAFHQGSIPHHILHDKPFQMATHVNPECEWLEPFPRTQSPKVAVQCDDDSETLKLWEKQQEHSPQYVSQLGGNTSEAWLTSCYERRRIFKLEAKSIKKILAMMRLVTDAMEKDLATADWVMCSANNVASNVSLRGTSPTHTNGAATPNSPQVEMVTPTSQQLPNQKAENEMPCTHTKESGGSAPVTHLCPLNLRHSGALADRFEIETLKKLQECPQCSHHLTQTTQDYLMHMTNSASTQTSQSLNQSQFSPFPHRRSLASETKNILSSSLTSARQKEGKVEQEGWQGNSSTNKKDSQDAALNLTLALADPLNSLHELPPHENKNIRLSNSLETFTIKVSAERNTYGCVGAFTFFNQHEGLNYSSAVHCISEAMELKQKLQRSSSVSLLRSSVLRYNEDVGVDENQEMDSKCVDNDEDVDHINIDISGGCRRVLDTDFVMASDGNGKMCAHAEAIGKSIDYNEENLNPEFSDDDIFNSSPTESYKDADLAIYSNKLLYEGGIGVSNSSSSPNSSFNLFNSDYGNDNLYTGDTHDNDIDEILDHLNNTMTSPIDDTKSIQLDEDIRQVLTEYCDIKCCNQFIDNESKENRDQTLQVKLDLEDVKVVEKNDLERSHQGDDGQDIFITTFNSQQGTSNINCRQNQFGMDATKDKHWYAKEEKGVDLQCNEEIIESHHGLDGEEVFGLVLNSHQDTNCTQSKVVMDVSRIEDKKYKIDVNEHHDEEVEKSHRNFGTALNSQAGTSNISCTQNKVGLDATRHKVEKDTMAECEPHNKELEKFHNEVDGQEIYGTAVDSQQGTNKL